MSLIIRWSLLVISILATSLAAQEPGPNDQKVSVSRASKLLKDWLSDKEKKSTAAHAMLLRTRAADRSNIVAAFRKGIYVRPKKRLKAGLHRFKIAGEPGVGAGSYVVDLPRKYTGKKPFPVVMRIHGSGGRGDSFHKNSWSLGKLGDQVHRRRSHDPQKRP